MSWLRRLNRWPDWFRVLDRKLLRDLWHIRAQALAISLVIGSGVAVFVMSLGMMRSMDVTGQAYYDRYGFANLYAGVKRAPNYLIDTIRAIDGVSVATTRITAQSVLDVEGFDEPITGRFHSLPMRGDAQLNKVVLRSGRMIDPKREDEVLVSEAFAQSHGLTPGSRLSANLNGIKRSLRIVGLVLSPEYIYAISAGEMVPDSVRFGVVWIGRDQLAAAFGLEGAFNEVLIRLDRSGNEKEVIRQVDILLDRYGGVGAYGLSEHVSDQFLKNELDQLETMTRVLPPIFLAVAAFLLNVVLSRLIDTEREQIGLLKSFGYKTRSISWHYIKLVLVLTTLGVLMGWVFGAWLGRGMAELYKNYFVFPFLYFEANIDVFFLAALVSYGAALLGTAYAVLRATRLPPAEAMRPPAPVDYSVGLVHHVARVSWLDEPSRMIARHLLRRPFRAALAVVGIALALGLRIGIDSNFDSVDRMIELTFDYTARQNATLSLSEPREVGVMHAINRLPGVEAAEPFRVVPAKLRFGAAVEREAITGILPGARLNRLIDRDWNAFDPPPFGLMLSTSLAEQLGAGIGDMIDVEVMEKNRPKRAVRVSGLVEVQIGTPAYMHLESLNRLMREGPVISGAYLMTDSLHEAELFREAKEIPAIAGLASQDIALRELRKTLDENVGTTTFFNSLFATLIVFGVVYNNARISLSERARDLASLRVLGFRRSEVSFILLGELAILTLLALPFGVLAGLGLSWYLTQSFSTELFTLPFAPQTDTIAWSVLTVCAAAIVSALIVRHRVDRLDLIRVLKTRE